MSDSNTLLAVLVFLAGLQTFLLGLAVVYIINIHSDIHGGKR